MDERSDDIITKIEISWVYHIFLTMVLRALSFGARISFNNDEDNDADTATCVNADAGIDADGHDDANNNFLFTELTLTFFTDLSTLWTVARTDLPSLVRLARRQQSAWSFC